MRGCASNSQPMPTRKPGNTRLASITVQISERPGRSLRSASHASGTPSKNDTASASVANTNVLLAIFGRLGSLNSAAKFPKPANPAIMPCSISTETQQDDEAEQREDRGRHNERGDQHERSRHPCALRASGRCFPPGAYSLSARIL